MPKKILVVDDSTTVREQLSLALTAAGYAVVQAVDGQDALHKLGAHSDVAMMICDVNMPGVSGLDVLERVKSGGPHAALPIVILTTEGSPGLIERAKRAGAKAWVIKPFKDDLLVAMVARVVGPGG